VENFKRVSASLLSLLLVVEGDGVSSGARVVDITEEGAEMIDCSPLAGDTT
jgi:hypothetical protein